MWPSKLREPQATRASVKLVRPAPTRQQLWLKTTDLVPLEVPDDHQKHMQDSTELDRWQRHQRASESGLGAMTTLESHRMASDSCFWFVPLGFVFFSSRCHGHFGQLCQCPHSVAHRVQRSHVCRRQTASNNYHRTICAPASGTRTGDILAFPNFRFLDLANGRNRVRSRCKRRETENNAHRHRRRRHRRR